MNSRRYWKNRLPFLLTNLVCMAALTVFLLVCGNSVSAVVLILIVWALILLMGLVLTYWKRKRQMKKLLDMAEQLSERYLISEVMELPEQAEDQVYYQLLKMAGKSMLEQIGEVERERLEYKEYIEQWIHEIKTPITAMKLLCENPRTDWTKELLLELEKTNRFTEQALYYARSEHTEKDYSVREMALSQVVHQAIADNKYLLLQSGMRLEVEEMQDTVYSDEKWVRFILNQLIANAVKYRTEQPVLRISTHKRQDQVVLVVEDNGIGIAFSNIAFEAWLIDHFEKCYTEKTAEKLIADFDRILRAKGYTKGYAKEDKQMITDVLMPRLDEAVHNADVVMQNRVLKYKECRKDDNYPFCDWNSFTNVHKLIDALKLEKKLETDTQ